MRCNSLLILGVCLLAILAPTFSIPAIEASIAFSVNHTYLINEVGQIQFPQEVNSIAVNERLNTIYVGINNTLVVIDGATKNIIKGVVVGTSDNEIWNIKVDSINNHIWAFVSGGDVFEIDALTYATKKSLPIPTGL